MSEFSNKVAVVSGSSRGVGFALARALVERGARVVINARGRRRLEQSKSELLRMGGDVEAVCGDVSVWEDAQRIVQTAIDRYGQLDILINNAGVSMRGRFDRLSTDVCRQLVDTNLMGSIFLTKAAIHPIIQSKGQVVFISSVSGLFGLPKASLYCACKGALTHFCGSLRMELTSYGVHIGLIYLGFTEHDPEKRILTAKGSLVPSNRPEHHSQKQAANIILKAMEKRKKKVVMTPLGKFGWIAHRISPALSEKIIQKAQSCELKVYKRFMGSSSRRLN